MGIVEGKVCIVTGASGDIGRAVAEELLREGAFVAVGSRRESLVKEFVEEWAITYGRDRVRGWRLDVSDEKMVSFFVEKTVEAFGRVDGLANVAGYPMEERLWKTTLTEIDPEDIVKVIRVDVIGSFLMTKHVLAKMLKRRSGVIVNFSSTPALSGYDRGLPYTLAKSAILGLTKHIVQEYGRKGIRAYTLALGNIKTKPTVSILSKAEFEALERESPSGRWGTPEDVAYVVSFLMSNRSSYINGQTIVVDGGTVLLG